MRSAILFARGDEKQFYVAENATKIAEFLDFESVYDLGKDPSFVALFEELAVIELPKMVVVGTKWTRVA